MTTPNPTFSPDGLCQIGAKHPAIIGAVLNYRRAFYPKRVRAL